MVLIFIENEKEERKKGKDAGAFEILFKLVLTVNQSVICRNM